MGKKRKRRAEGNHSNDKPKKNPLPEEDELKKTGNNKSYIQVSSKCGDFCQFKQETELGVTQHRKNNNVNGIVVLEIVKFKE